MFGLPLLCLPVALSLALVVLARLPGIGVTSDLAWAVQAAALSLGVLSAVVWWLTRGRSLRLGFTPRPQHYLQACAHASILVYWGYYWRPVYDHVPHIAAQLLFAYAIDMLLVWSRRDHYELGFGPFPIVFSTNLFLWFRDEWFYWQFLMIALGFVAKDLIRWERDGRRVHVFNPSSFPLAIASLVLIATGATAITWGEEIARTQFNPPNIYVFLFLVALPGQLLFGVTTMTMSAVVSTYLFGLAYLWATGTYFFIDSYIPVAVFLGMHLLFTDPSTAPKTEIGRIVFGVLYGFGNIALYALFGAFGIPQFYDKLLPVPLMNLSVRAIDRLAPRLLRAVDPARLRPTPVGRKRNFVYMSVWSAIFVGMLAADGVGDNHPGHRVPFWLQACQQDRFGACTTLDRILTKYCSDGSGWACNEHGVLVAERKLAGVRTAAADFALSCRQGFATGCQNQATATSAASLPRRAPPVLADYPVVLRVGKGSLPDSTPREFFARACDQGWASGCDDLAGTFLRGADRNPARARELLERACSQRLGSACSNLGFMYQTGDGVPRDEERALAFLKQGCDFGFARACRWLAERQAPQARSVP